MRRVTMLQNPQAARAHYDPHSALLPPAGQAGWRLAQGGWLRVLFAFTAAVALAVVLLFALAPEPPASPSGQAGSVFSATTPETCTLPRFETRTTTQHVADKPAGPHGGAGRGDADSGGWRHAEPADCRLATGQALTATPPAQDHAARTAEARAPPHA